MPAMIHFLLFATIFDATRYVSAYSHFDATRSSPPITSYGEPNDAELAKRMAGHGTVELTAFGRLPMQGMAFKVLAKMHIWGAMSIIVIGLANWLLPKPHGPSSFLHVKLGRVLSIGIGPLFIAGAFALALVGAQKPPSDWKYVPSYFDYRMYYALLLPVGLTFTNAFLNAFYIHRYIPQTMSGYIKTFGLVSILFGLAGNAFFFVRWLGYGYDEWGVVAPIETKPFWEEAALEVLIVDISLLPVFDVLNVVALTNYQHNGELTGQWQSHHKMNIIIYNLILAIWKEL
jgi:hypothetical protein